MIFSGYTAQPTVSKQGRTKWSVDIQRINRIKSGIVE